MLKKITRDCGGRDAPVSLKVRRRRKGMQGRPEKAPIIKELLFEWFSVLRNSVCTRISPKFVMLKASTLVDDYVKECLKKGVAPDPPRITNHWLSSWKRRYRLSLRRPNRKYKVPLAVLEERLQAFWLNLARVRKFVQMMKGYDPAMSNCDQSPYHKK